MKILQNTATGFLTSNFIESETLWSGAAVYNYRAEARDGHYIYAYAGTDATNTILSPATDYALNAATKSNKWVQIRPTNYFAMIDQKTITKTQNPNSIEFSVASIGADAISLMGLEAISAYIEIFDNNTSTVVFTKYYDLKNTNDLVDFKTYCFEEFSNAVSIFDDTLPIYSNATLSVTIDNGTNIAKCGRLVVGRTYYIGEAGISVSLGLESYSRKETDVFGNTDLYHSDSVNIDSFEVYVITSKIPSLRRKFKEIDAVPMLFIIDDNPDSEVENLLNFGYYQSFSVMIPDSNISTASITIKGLL